MFEIKSILGIFILSSFSVFSSFSQDKQLTDSEVKALINTHNRWRADVGVPPLSWSEKLADYAADWAKNLKRQNCAFKHRQPNDYGENLFQGTADAFDATYVVDAWGNEVEDYNYKKNKCSGVCGHYTQVVWKGTKEVGCAKIECKGMDIWVCNYNPPGNWVGEKPY